MAFGLGEGIALGAQVLGGVLGGKSNRKAAEKANKENRKLEAITNIIRLAGGQGPSGFGQEQAVGGSTLSDLLSGGGQAAGALIQQQAQDKIAEDAVTQKNLVDQSLMDARGMQSAAAMLRALNPSTTGRKSSTGVQQIDGRDAIDLTRLYETK